MRTAFRAQIFAPLRTTLRRSLLLACCTAGAGAALAQVVPASGAAAAPPPSTSNEQAVKLDPFQVQADSDQSYGALNSNSITRFNTELNKLPISADIYDQAFMDDIAASSVEQMVMRYSAGAGFSTTQASNGTTQPGDLNADSSVQIRGLATPSYERDGFLPLSSYSSGSTTYSNYTSNFDLERVEIIEGPESILYSSGGGGGVLNMVSKQARFDRPSNGSAMYQIDQYGHKLAQLDFGMGTNNFAVRFDAFDQVTGGRRLFIGGRAYGDYLQIAARIGNTVIRILGEETHAKVGLSAVATLNATGDARTGDSLDYLLATNQINAPTSGANTAGVIDHGLINWGNVDSWGNERELDTARDSFTELTADTKWTRTISTQLSLGYKNYWEDYSQPAVTMVAPGVSTNPYPSDWSVSEAISGTDNYRTGRNKVIRGTILHESDLFGGAVHSQSVLGVDASRIVTSFVVYSYFQTDGSGNLLPGPASTAGRVAVPTTLLYYPAENGISNYFGPTPLAGTINLGGLTYSRQIQDPPNSVPRTGADPLGLLPGGASSYYVTTLNRGIFGANYASFLNDKLHTIVGFRQASDSQSIYDPGGANPAYARTGTPPSGKFNYQVGVNYQVLPWLSPYAQIGTTYNPVFSHGADPYGQFPLPSSAVGEEAGIKIAVSDKLSGSVSYYHDNSKNEVYAVTATLITDINPSGLNGRFGAPSIFVNTDRVVNGFQTELTGSPLPNLRFRLSAAVTTGTVGTNNIYPQVYNDQFYENGSGQVTYADGTVVFVPPAFNSKQLTVPSTTAGAIPLTVTALSTPGNAYFASPLAVNGQITQSSPGGLVLSSPADPVHGSILTGKTGLPMTAYQLNPALTGVPISGPITVTAVGDLTTGYAKYSMALTGVYSFTNGPMKGLFLGGTESAGWDVRGYYYYPQTTVTPTETRNLFMRPQVARFDLIAGWVFKFSHITFSTQININNMFNHYEVIIQPAPVGGFNSSAASTQVAYWTDQPRAYMWTNTIRF